MGDQEQFFASQYARLNDEELLRMHQSGGLTDIAYGVLEQQLSSRNLTIPPRPSAPAIEQKAPLLDRAPLWVRLIVFSFVVFLISVIYGAIYPPPPSMRAPALFPGAAAFHAPAEALRAVLFQGLPILLMAKILLFRKRRKDDPRRNTDA